MAIGTLVQKFTLKGLALDWIRSSLSSKSCDRSKNINNQSQLLCARIDEEGQGYLSDLKSEWINLELSQGQIKIKELMFIIDRYWGRFIAWMRLPRFSTFTRIR